MREIIQNRLRRFRETLREEVFDTFLVVQEENRFYLSGFTGEDLHFNESAGFLFITQERQILSTDFRYEAQAVRESPEFEVYCYKNGLAESLPEILKMLNTERLGFEGTRLSYFLFERFKECIRKAGMNVALISRVGMVEDLRMIKEPWEIKAISESLRVTESVFQTFYETLSPDVSEKAAAWTIERLIRERGAQSVAFPLIAASGPNSALPHARPTDRIFKRHEPILFDLGARVNSYCSDMSRTIVLGEPDDTFKKLFQIVEDAQKMAIEAIKPGVRSDEVDRVARDYISAKGFKDRFRHALGHGVGLSTHEMPSLSPFKPVVLQAGMVVTVEPGIYLPDWGGVRLENMVLIEEDGASILNRL